MSLLAMLKKGELRQTATAIPATFATVAPLTPTQIARVATVAVANQQKPLANDPTPTPSKAVDIGTVRPPGLSPKLLAASLALDAQILAYGALPGDADYCCWPHSTAMTGAEIGTFTARLARFTDKGTSMDVSEALADKLVIRDRELDDRRLCLECRHLAGYGPGSWRCGNWQAAGIAIKARDNQLPPDLILLLQRCAGFTDVINPTTKVS